jgi:predicted molibdopterin-dependent oxidoreductase YjgC
LTSDYFDCDLRKYADEFNIDLGDYLGEVRKFKVDKRHPYIALDPNKCINCGKCVRTCNEILAVSALGFVNRGFKAVVKPAMEKPLLQTNCISCGNCIDVCPTGAISEKFPFKILGTMPKLNETSVCNFCSLGCKVNFKVVDNDIYFVSNSTEEIIDSKNNGYLCVKGRFGHRYLLDKNRLKEPGIRINGKLKTASLDDTMIFASDKIKEIISKYGKDSVAVFASPKSSNEELYMLQKFARVALKNNNITSLSEMLYGVEPHSLDDILGATVSTTTINEIKNTDVIIVMNPDIEENLILELQIKEARKKGAKLVLISSSESSMSGYADLWIDSRKGTKTILINGLINSLINWKDEKFAKLKETVSQFDPNTVSSVTGVDVRKIEDLIDIVKNKENNIVFVYNLDSVKDKSRNDIKAVCNLMSITGRIYKENNGLVLLREFSNSTGLQDNGATPSYLPGYVKFGQVEEINRIAKAWDTDLNGIFKPVDILKDINQGKIKAAIIFGENPFSITENRKYFNDVEFLMVIDSFNTETAQEADVIIPAATFAEQTGSYTSCDTMVQTVEPVIVNKNNLDNWKIISKFAEYFNVRFNLKSYNDLNEEISRVNRVYGSCKPGEYWVNSKENIKLLQDQKKADYLTYQVDMTTYNPVKPGIHYSDKYLETIRKQINL